MYLLTEDQSRLFDCEPQNSDVQLTVLNVWVSAEAFRMLPAPAPVACTHLVAATAARYFVGNTDGHPPCAATVAQTCPKNHVILSTGESNFVP
jgi:hypothetical protein